MSTQPVELRQSILFGEDFALDLRPRRLRRGDHVLKLERIPLEILLLLLERPGEIVTRDEIISRIWGNDVFLDTDNSTRGAIRKIRQALRDDPETPRFIQTVTGRGYRFIAPVISPEQRYPTEAPSPEGSATSTDAQSFVSEPHSRQRDRTLRVADEEPERTVEQLPDGEDAHGQEHRRARSWLFVGLAALAVASLLALLAFWRWQGASGLPTAPQHKTVLAVLPFDNLNRDPDQEFFSAGLTEEMIAQLGKLNRDQLTVIARSTTAKYKESKLSAREIGRELNADYLVQGSVRRWSDRVRITVQLIDSKSQTDLWTESYDLELKDVLAVQDSVDARKHHASQVHIALREEEKTRLNSRQPVAEAYVAYLKGRYYWNKRTGDSIQTAEQYFQQAIDSDPNYAAAYSGLADCNSGLAWHGFKSPSDALTDEGLLGGPQGSRARSASQLRPTASLGLVLSHRWRLDASRSRVQTRSGIGPSRRLNAHPP